MTHRYASSSSASADETLRSVRVTPILGPIRGVAHVAVGHAVGVAAIGSRAGLSGQRPQQAGRAEARHQKGTPPFLDLPDVAVRQLRLVHLTSVLGGVGPSKYLTVLLL